jgi:hypothetical protein
MTRVRNIFIKQSLTSLSVRSARNGLAPASRNLKFIFSAGSSAIGV